jgi:hypothetical protein
VEGAASYCGRCQRRIAASSPESIEQHAKYLRAFIKRSRVVMLADITRPAAQLAPARLDSSAAASSITTAA